jgi:hypothetical protein
MPHYEVSQIEETPIDLIHPVEIELVRDELTETPYDFRTARGIHNATSLPIGDVVSILENTDIARKTVFKTPQEGNPIYASADRKKKFRERLAEFQWILAR